MAHFEIESNIRLHFIIIYYKPPVFYWLLITLLLIIALLMLNFIWFKTKLKLRFGEIVL